MRPGMVFHLMSWLMGTGEGDAFLSDTVTVSRHEMRVFDPGTEGVDGSLAEGMLYARSHVANDTPPSANGPPFPHIYL